MKRKSYLRSANSKRRRKLRGRQFGAQAELCRSLPCHACLAPPPSDPHHVKSRGAGGTDEHCVPLCRSCHNELHTVGLHDFQNRWMCDLWAFAEDLQQKVRAAG